LQRLMLTKTLMSPNSFLFRTFGTASVIVVVILLAACARSGEPSIVREDIEWSRMWVPGVNQTDRPHVLLIGDSITEAYCSVVEKELGTEAYVAKLTTSKSLGDPAFLDEVALVLRNAKFQVIHFNNGMHGAGYAESDYRRDLPKLVGLLRKGGQDTKLICATTTPKRVPNQLDKLDAFTERIKIRNRIAQEFARKNNLIIDDLYKLVVSHPEFYSNDGTHFKDSGVQAEGLQVAQMIRSALNGQSPQ
jgi:hypothetical protein